MRVGDGRPRNGFAAAGSISVCGIMVLSAGASPGSAGPEVTFAEDVAPILHARCASCHRPGGPAPFSLLTYDDAVDNAEAIVDAVTARRMPPWLPDPGDVAFQGDRRLTPPELEDLVSWEATGRLPGDLSAVVLPDFPDGWRLGQPDLTVRTAEPYPVPSTGGDVFRNLVIRTGVTARTWVRGLEIRFSDPSVVHHAMVTLDVTRSSRRMDALDPEPGFDGMLATTEALGPSGFLLGWTPGHEPALSPDDFAFPLDPGTDIVLQMHLRPTGRSADLSAEIGLHTSNVAPTRTPFTLRLGVQEIDIPAGEGAYTLTDSYELPAEVEVRGLYPHAHFLGRAIELVAIRPDSGRVRILDIPRWNFNWQDAYRLESPLVLPSGTRLEARFTYDNSEANPSNPARPPRRVLYGPRSDDEMGDIWIQVVPGREEDLPTIARHFAGKDLRSRISGWEHTLTVRPGDPVALTGLGTVDQARGQHYAAVGRFRAALAARPDYVVARYNMAISLERSGRLDQARREYETVIEQDPEHQHAHNNLGLLLAGAGELSRAIAEFEAAVRAEPSFAEGHNNLGNALRQNGDLGGAARALLLAVELSPEYRAARMNLALLAWTRATAADETRRDGQEAVRLAEAAAEGPAAQDPRVLDVLGAAYAEAGRFDEAIDAARRAIEIAREVGDSSSEFVAAVEGRLDLYERGQPFHFR